MSKVILNGLGYEILRDEFGEDGNTEAVREFDLVKRIGTLRVVELNQETIEQARTYCNLIINDEGRYIEESIRNGYSSKRTKLAAKRALERLNNV